MKVQSLSTNSHQRAMICCPGNSSCSLAGWETLAHSLQSAALGKAYMQRIHLLFDEVGLL